MKDNSFQQQIFAMIEENTGKNPCIAIPQAIFRFCGVHDAAVLLSQLIYWCDKGKSPDRYIFKTYCEWHDETHLSEYRVKKAAKKLEAMGILKIKKKKAHGAPTMHYKLDCKALTDAFLKFLRNETENLKNSSCNPSESITKNTSEITTENFTMAQISREICASALSFKEYEKEYELSPEVIHIIKYFLNAYKKCMGKEHPKLKPEQWDSVEETLLTCNYEEYDTYFDLSVEDLEAMIDNYFDTQFHDDCNYSILHFNTPGIKVRRMYDAKRY